MSNANPFNTLFAGASNPAGDRMEEIDTLTVDSSLKKLVKGGALIFTGTMFGLVIQVLNRVFIVRSISRPDYGLLSLGLVIFSIAAALSQGGFQLSMPRFLGYYRGKEDESRIRGIIRSTFEIELLLGIILSFILFFGAEAIQDFFQEDGLDNVLRIFAVQIPLFNLIHIVTLIFKGYGQARPELYFNKFILLGVRFSLLLAVVMTTASLSNVLLAYAGAHALTAVAALIYYLRKKPLPFTGAYTPMRKELFLFTLPLLGSVFLGHVTNWTDILILGRFASSDLIGLYSGAVPIAGLVPVFLGAAGFLFIPVLSVCYSQGKFTDMQKTYSILTKWIFSTTFPVFLIVFIFPRVVLTSLFGTDYEGASTALRILVSGYMIHVLMGPIGQNLVIFGKTRLIFFNNTLGLLINVFLNIVLIPLYGINGAATATACTYVFLNLLALTEVYIITKMHPFSRNYVKPLVSSAFLLVVYAGLFRFMPDIPYWMLPAIFILFCGSYVVMVFITRSFDREDMMMAATVEKKTGVNLTWLRRILKKVYR